MQQKEAELRVDRRQLEEALKKLVAGAPPRVKQRLYLSFDGSWLALSTTQGATVVEAKGHWPGVARVGARGFTNLRRVLPDTDELTLICSAEKLN